MEKMLMRTLKITNREDKNGNLRPLNLNLRCDLAYVRRTFKRALATKKYEGYRLILNNFEGIQTYFTVAEVATHEGRTKILEELQEFCNKFIVIKIELVERPALLN